jgi:hypothetical protein
MVMKNQTLQQIVLPIRLVEELGYFEKYFPHISISLGDA